MTAYPFPAASPAPPAAASADPTAVMGRRIGAFVIDFLLYVLIMAFVGPTPLSPLAEYYPVGDGVDDACEVVRDLNDDVSGCVEIGDRVYFTTTGDVAVQIVTWLAFVGLYAALQGATGRTPGKAVFGLKVVNEQGGNPGFGRGLGRTLLWIVDGQPCGLPLVGFITGLTTKGHRRVGDMAVKTFVVGKAHTGPVVVPGLTTAAGPYGGAPGAPGAPWGPAPTPSGPPGWGGPVQPQAPWGGPPSGGYPPPGASGPPTRPPGPPTTAPGPAPRPGAAATPPGQPAPSPAAGRPGPPAPGAGTPAAPRPAAPSAGEPAGAPPRDEPERPVPPGSATAGDATPAGPTPTSGGAPSTGGKPSGGTPYGGTPSGGTPSGGTPSGGGTPAGAAGQAAPSGYNPQWDAARGTYIVWEPQRGQWLGWDEATRQWRPL